MKAGVISIDITPQMGAPLAGNPRPVNAAVGVHDPIAANIICLDDGDTRVFLIGMDLLGIEVDTCEKICAGITRATGVPGENIMISATHTHSGPNAPRLYYSAYEDPQIMEKEAGEVETYLEQLVEKVVAGAVAAAKDMTECTLSFGQASDGRFSHNRRLRMKDGSICMIFEPYRLEDIVCLSDPVSADTVSVLKISAPDGKILALYVHYATHPAIACGLDFLVSRDFPGWMTDCLKAQYGEDLVVLYANGAEGNMAVPAPEEGFHNTFEECARVGTQLAQTVIDMVPNTKEMSDTVLNAVRTSIQVQYRSFTEAEVAAAEQVLKTAGSNEQQHGAPPKLSALATLKFHGLRGQLDTLPIQGITIGNLLLMAVTTETFRDLAIQMENRWDGPALLVGMANGYHGYIPTEQAFSEGGYEVLPNEDSRYEPDSDKKLLDGMFRIQDLLKRT